MCSSGVYFTLWSSNTFRQRSREERKEQGTRGNVSHVVLLYHCPYIACLCFQPHGLIEHSCTGKPRGRQQPKQPRQSTDVTGVINISDDSSTESDAMDSDSNSSPDSVQDNNDDVIFVNQTSYQMGMLTVYYMVQLILAPCILMIFPKKSLLAPLK